MLDKMKIHVFWRDCTYVFMKLNNVNTKDTKCGNMVAMNHILIIFVKFK